MLSISLGGIPPTEKNGIDGFFSRFYVFLLGGWGEICPKKKLSNPSKAPFMAFGPSTSRSWSQQPPMNPTKDVSSRFFVKHFTSDYVSNSASTRKLRGRGLWWHCVSFRSVFHVSKFSHCSGSSWTPTIPSTRRLPLSRCSRANTARQSRPSLL